MYFELVLPDLRGHEGKLRGELRIFQIKHAKPDGQTGVHWQQTPGMPSRFVTPSAPRVPENLC